VNLILVFIKEILKIIIISCKYVSVHEHRISAIGKNHLAC